MTVHPPRGCPAVTPGPPAPQVTTDLLSRGGKDIAFASYGPLWKFQRKLVHTALSMFGEGSLALERISECLSPAPAPPALAPSHAVLFLLKCPDSLDTKERQWLSPCSRVSPQLARQGLCPSPYIPCTLPTPLNVFSTLNFSSPHSQMGKMRHGARSPLCSGRHPCTSSFSLLLPLTQHCPLCSSQPLRAQPCLGGALCRLHTLNEQGTLPPSP